MTKTSTYGVLILALGTGSAHAVTPPTRPLPSPVWGVTTDSTSSLSSIVTSLKNLSKMPMTRIVFDENVAAKDYKDAVTKIAPVSYVMGELLDSYYVRQYSLTQYKKRATEYIDLLGDKVDLWEIGNEVNGEWLGTTKSVVDKIQAAYDIAKSKNVKTALTLYYNEGCWEKSSNEMFKWAEANLSAGMKQGLDYVWISYYEDDCNGRQPDWQDVFTRLGAMFPNSKIGIGECGTKRTALKASYVNRYYGMEIDHPNYVGGYFWWYFKQDMVPFSKPLWKVLDLAIQ